MAWESIGLVKNDFNEYRFCYIPNFENFYFGGVGGSDTTIRIGGLRNSNDDPGSAAFQLGKSYVSAIAAQDDIFNVMDDPLSGCDTYVYGTVGGEAIRLLESTTQSTWFWNFNFTPHKLTTNMQSDLQLATFTGNVLKDQSKNENTVWTWGLAYNADEEKCYLMIITSTLYWNYAIGSPDWYDNAEVVIVVCDSNLTDNNLYNLLKDSIPGGGGGEPYIGGGTSTSGGGTNATFDLTSDNINIPSLPSISASGAGLLTLYQVSLQNMIDFASYLWSPLFDVATLKKLFNDPMDAIISLGMLPFTPTGGGTSNIFIGTSDSGVSAIRLGSQYYEIDMGSVLLDTFYDSALDLNPYTKVEIYLPYCGTVSINPDEFDGKSIHVVYHVDILTGACVVFVEDGSRVLVQSQGNILTTIPFTAKDFKSIFGAVLGDAAAAGAAIGALATGGISAVAGGIGLVSHVALNTVNSKVNTPHGGQCASTAGFLSVQKPYLIITRPAQCLPEDNAAYQGYPAYITAKVGDLTGFIKIGEAHFDKFTCTDGELNEIDRLLKEGVYVQ